MRSLFLVVFISLISNFCYTQSNINILDRRNIYDEKGDYYFDQKEFKKAIVYFNMAYKKDASNYYSVLRKAEAFTELKLFTQAAECYRIIFETDLRIGNIYRLQYAFVLLELDNIKGFERWLEEYNKIIESEIGGKNYISTAENRAKLYKDSTIIIVNNVKELNTKYSEISPVANGDDVLFASSMRNVNGDIANAFYNFYSASYLENGEFNKLSIYNKNLNSPQTECALSFFDINNTMYFSRGSSQKSNLKAYNSNIPLNENDVLDLTEVVFDGFNDIGHIAMNTYGNTMYFVSNSTGGNGELDIYSSNLVNGKWSAPQNLGDNINTSGNEMYPYIYNDSILFFSSDGHIGKGGYDIYSVNLNETQKSVQNLGSEVNTPYDDYGLTLGANGITGYFSSNRPGGAGKEDIYRVHILNLKVKYAAYRYNRKTFMEEDKINLYLSNGDEYNITSKDNSGFNFDFQPEEDYVMVIQHENPTADNIIHNKALTGNKKTKEFLNPTPLDKAEIQLQAGIKYKFTAGVNPISSQYIEELNGLTDTYQDPETSTIDLTALAKELLFDEGEIYTIQFKKDDSNNSGYKAKGETSLFINDKVVSIYGRSFFIVLPLDIEASFNIQTDINYFKENFNPKRYGLVIDQGSVFKAEEDWSISMIVNTEAIEEVKPENRLKADGISIIPGTEYILSLSKLDQLTGEDIEIIVPLTRGVKYNLGSETNTQDQFQKSFAAMVLGRDNINTSNEEVIDISILSKELEIKEGEYLKFNLLPAKTFGKKSSTTEPINTVLTLDGVKYNLAHDDKYSISLPFNTDQKLNIQTDIDFVLENFKMDEIILALDTLPFFGAITIDTTGLSSASPDWLSVSVNTESLDEVEEQNKLVAQELSIIPGKEYILTVSKKDAKTKKETEIIVPLTRKVKYDFTSNPISEEEYQQSLNEFLASQSEYETTGGELIDISLLSKELEIKEGDEISFSLLPAKVFKDGKIMVESARSSLYLDSKVVEFTQIQKYTINVPLNNKQVNIQTDIEHIRDNFEPGSFSLDVDTISFFSEITVDTTGYGFRAIKDEGITDPVFDVIVVNFDLNSFSLKSKAMYTIDNKVIEELLKDNRLYVTIKGYTDALGNAEYNKKLSKDRAQSVKDYLTVSGVGENRIRTFSFGAEQALKEGVNWEDLDDAELAKHRKVEIVMYLPEKKK